MNAADFHWWLAPKSAAHERVFTIVSRIDQNQREFQIADERHYALYANKRPTSLTPGHHKIPEHSEGDLIAINVAQSCLDTLHSKICVHRPRPLFLTAAGTTKLQRKAKGLQKYTDGAMYAAQVYKHSARAFVDAGIFGNGYLKVYGDYGRICVERTFPAEIIVDEQAALTSNPQSLFQRKYIDATVIQAMYPEVSADKLTARTSLSLASAGAMVHLVECIEGWHLPSCPGAKDGRHVICVSGETLLDEAWDRDRFPFAVFRWNERQLGWTGQGLVEQLEGLQIEINRIARFIQRSQQLLSAGKWLVPKGTKIRRESMNNRIGELIYYEGGQPPQLVTSPAVHPEIYGHLWQLVRQAYEISGVSQMSAASKKPAGDLSGVALRTLNDVETQRFGQLVRQWEDFHLQVAELIVDESRQMAEEGEDLSATFSDGTVIEPIRWKDVDLKRDQYELQVFPTSMLPMQPEGRLQTVLDMIAGQVVQPDEARRLINFPDLQKHSELATAPLDFLHMIFDSILEGGEYIPPMDAPGMADEGIGLAYRYYARARCNGASQDVLDNLLLWIDQAAEKKRLVLEGMQQIAAAQQAAPQVGGPSMGVQ